MTEKTTQERPARSEEASAFAALGLSRPLCAALAKAGYEKPTPIQEKAIPDVLKGRDLLGCAQTGTGKTAAFALPILNNLRRNAPGLRGRPRVLVLAPTRELAAQIGASFAKYGRGSGLRHHVIFGGVGKMPQKTALKNGLDILVATPGRLLDLMGEGFVDLSRVCHLVLDEADRMLDMGFLPDINRIMDKLPKDRQTLMFSATFPDSIARLTGRMLRDPQRISVGAIEKPVDTVRQTLYPVRQEHKTRLILEILSNEDPAATLVFLRTKIRTETLGHVLKKKGFKVAQLHGDRSQSQRQQALDGFRKGKYDILVATDVAARGLDIEGVTHVFNYDIPLNPEDYIHRIGRTARAKAEGDAITFVTPAEFQALGGIEKALGHNLNRAEWDDAPRVLSVFHPVKSKRSSTRRRNTSRRLLRRR